MLFLSPISLPSCAIEPAKAPRASPKAGAFSARISDQSSGLDAPTRVRSRKDGPAKDSASGEMSEATFKSAAAMRWRQMGEGGHEQVVLLRVYGR